MASQPTAGELAEQVRAALDSADLAAIGELLHPDVRWGAPGDPEPSCRNRAQVLAWYRRGRDAGVRARVAEVVAHGDKILVGLTVAGRAGADEKAGAESDRWEVLTVGEGQIVDIRGFDDRGEAADYAGMPPGPDQR